MHLRSGLKKLQDDSDPERISSFYSFLMFFPWCLYLYVFTKHNSVYLPLVSRILKVEWTKKMKSKIFTTQMGIWNSLFIPSFRHLSGAASSVPGGLHFIPLLEKRWPQAGSGAQSSGKSTLAFSSSTIYSAAPLESILKHSN